MTNDTAVVTCFFNFAGFDAPQRNVRRWQRQMQAQGIPAYGVEIYLDGTHPVTRGWVGWKQLLATPSLHIMFQKEAALNICVTAVPPRFTKIVIVDCDVYFDNTEWLARTSAVLEVVNACSAFQEAHWTNAKGEVDISRNSLGVEPTKLSADWLAHCGFAMGLRRDFWAPSGPNGLFPYYITGNGDMAMGTALAGASLTHEMFTTAPHLLPGYMAWYYRVRQWSKGVSYIQGNVFHEFHGSWHNRKYVERASWMKELNPTTHLKFNDSGLLEWLPAAPETMVNAIAQYFTDRKEDE